MKLLIILTLLAGATWAQNPGQIIFVTTSPAGQTCANTRINEKTPDGIIYTCQNGHMAAATATGGGATIPATTSTLKGDGAGNAAAVTGTGTNCVLVNGTSTGCPTSVANYSQTFTTQTSVTLTHNLNTTAVIAQCYDNGTPPQQIVWNTLQLTDSNDVTVTFTNAQTGKCVISANLSASSTISLSTACGIGGGPITTTGTVTGQELVNSQTGTSYAIVNGDCGKLITLANSSPVAVSIAQAGSGGNFVAGWYADIQNTGAGTLTLTPATSTINGGATLVLLTQQGIRVISDGANYFVAGALPNGGTIQNITINNSTINNSTAVSMKCQKCSLNGTELTNLYPNAASTGTTANKLAKLTGAGTVVLAATTDTGGVLGICTNSTATGASACGTSGSSEIAEYGTFSCVFDGATTADDYVTISSSVAGDCHDFGATYPIGQQVLGRVLVTAAAGTRSMTLFGPESNSSGIKEVQAVIAGPADVTTVANGQYYFVIPAGMTNYRLTGVVAQTVTAGTTGPTTVAITRCAHAATGNICSGATAQMLSTNINVDSATNSSADAGTPPVINTANATITTNQVIRVDVSAVSSTPAQGLILNMEFTTP